MSWTTSVVENANAGVNNKALGPDPTSKSQAKRPTNPFRGSRFPFLDLCYVLRFSLSREFEMIMIEL